MELVFNELSLIPLADNENIAEERFKTILKTFNEAKSKYDFVHIRFPKSYWDQQITQSKTFYEWVTTLPNKTLKDAIIKLLRPPFTDELEDAEQNTFFKSNYLIASEEAPERNSPVGLPVAFIKSVPCISLNSHEFWRSKKIEVSKSGEEPSENAEFFTYNLCMPSDINSAEITEWAENCLPGFINSKELLIKYLSYIKYSVEFTDAFLEQIFEWKDNDLKSFKYILLLMKDVELHPFTGGRGQTENLKSKGKEASKRINIKDRLSYTVENNVVNFLACKGHYAFH